MNNLPYLNKVIYKKALKRWGHCSQIMMAMEELAELQVICSKINRNNGTPPDYSKLYEEIVDVQIMIEQLICMFNLCDEVLKHVKERKLLKLELLLEKQ